jgi:hypothetical protein
MSAKDKSTLLSEVDSEIINKRYTTGQDAGQRLKDIIDSVSVSGPLLPKSVALDASNYNTLQDAANDVETDSNIAKEHLVIPPSLGLIDETVDLDVIGMLTVLPGGTYPHIEGDGDHTVKITSQDQTLHGGWIDQVGTGSYDAVHVASPEVQIEEVDIDFSPRYGLYIDASRCQSDDVQVKNCDVIAVLVDTNAQRNTHNNLIIQNANSTGLECRGDYNTFSNVVVKAPGDNGVNIKGQYCRFSGIVRGAGINGIFVSGAHSKIDANIEDPTNIGLLIDSGTDAVVADVVTTGGSDGVVIQGDGNFVKAAVSSVSNDGVVIEGNKNVVILKDSNATGKGLRVSGKGNYIIAAGRPSVIFESGSEGNVLVGAVKDNVNDNGTRNIINGENAKVVDIPDGETTPFVGTFQGEPVAKVYRTSNTSATTINDFDSEKQRTHRITLLIGDQNTTIKHGSGLALKGSQDYTTSEFDRLQFVYDGSTWWELSRTSS